MANIGRKLKTKEVIILLTLGLIGTGCEDHIDNPEVDLLGGKTVEVTLNVGIATEVDGAAMNALPVRKASNKSAFDVQLVPSIQTKSATKPTSLYNLEIGQYNYTTGMYVNGGTIGTKSIGESFTVGLNASTTENPFYSLIIIARGEDNTVSSLGTQALSKVHSIFADATKLSKVSTDGTNINKMPYILYLPKVKISGDGKIQSPEGSDVRLLLKRLAVRLTLDWTFSAALTNTGYSLKEVRLFQVPADYRILPEVEKTQKWGPVYPSSISEFVDGFRLTGTSLDDVNTYTIWMPANAQGASSEITYPFYRTKQYVNPATTYVEFVVDNAAKQERLYYRTYLGGNTTSDFNLFENTDYHWTVNINSANYVNDPRISFLDQTPVKSFNMQSTSNCFMMKPGTNICFNPYKHEAGTDGWNTELVTKGAIQSNKEITSVKVLWQTKDAGTSGDLVMWYVIDGSNHQNLVNLTAGNDVNEARVHIKIPNTNGGNAVIAAYNSSGTIVWSWHLWISDYVPVGLSNAITAANRQAAIEVAQSATQGGMVHVYGGISWTDLNGAFYKCVMMDRHLGAIRAGMQKNQLDGVRTFGLIYQGGRKDPFFSSADGSTKETKTIYNGNGEEVSILRNISFSNYAQTINNPLAFCLSDNAMISKDNAWNGDKPKTIYDPCPKGWRVPSNEYLNNAGLNGGVYIQRDGDSKSALVAGFGYSTNSSYVTGKTNSDDISSPGNLLYYDGSTLHEMSAGKNASDFPGSGYLYIGGSGESKDSNSNKSAFFPGVSLREYNSGNYRSNNNNNALYLWSSTKNIKSGKPAYLEFNQISADGAATGKVNLCFQLNDHRIYGFSVRCIQDNIHDREPSDYSSGQ